MKVDVYDTNLNLLKSITTSNGGPYGIAYASGYLYVGTDKGYMYKFSATTYTTSYSPSISQCGGTYINDVYSDSYGYLALNCFAPRNTFQPKVFVFNTSPTYQNLYYTNAESWNNGSTQTTVDSKGRYIVMRPPTIDIYYN